MKSGQWSDRGRFNVSFFSMGEGVESNPSRFCGKAVAGCGG
jgi:hypothetical protein